MNHIDETIWNKLTTPSGDNLIARIGLPEITTTLSCCLDSNGKRHFLIGLQKEDNDFYDYDSRGVRIITRDLLIQGQTLNRYYDIECLDPTGYSIFNIIGEEIALEISKSNLRSSEIIKRVLTKWRRFWGQNPKQLLSREEQLGLFAEIWFLVEWLIPKLGESVVMVWQGPWKSRHDFEWKDKSVEIKATTNSRGHIHKINGINQLENPENGPLYLFSMLLHEEVGAKYNLTGLIDRCNNILATNDEYLSRFEVALVNCGYFPIFQEEYAKLNIRVLEELLFLVNSDFPKIINSSFPVGLPSGVEHLEYEINLNNYQHLIIAKSAKDMQF